MDRKKEFTYRGKSLEELKALDVRSFAKHLKSKPRRSVLRNFQVVEKFASRCKVKIQKSKQVKTHQRDIIIVPEMVGMKIQVYNGNGFIPVEVSGEMLGHRLGEFAPSRKKISHGSAGVGSTKGSKHKSKK